MEHFYVAFWLMEIFHELLQWFDELTIFFATLQEVQGFGINFLTLIFLITLTFTAMQSTALFEQNKKIIQNKSGESVSFLFFCFFGFATLAASIYGFYKLSLALVINGLSFGFFNILIIINLLRYEKITLLNLVIGFSAVIAIPLIIILPQKDEFFLIFGFIILSFLGKQIHLVWRNKKVGSLHPGPAIISIMSSSFWLIYSFSADNVEPIKIFNPIAIILWTILLTLYFVYKKREVVA